MSKTYYIDCNRYNAYDSESDNTNKWTYALKETIAAPAGTEIKIQNAFINQKGITGQSIEFERDFEEVIKYNCYIVDDIAPIPANINTPRLDSAGLGLPLLYDDMLRIEPRYWINADANTPTNWEEEYFGFTVQYKVKNRYALYRENIGGCMTPLILCSGNQEANFINNKPFLYPIVRTTNVTIKKGIYSVNQLLVIINNQLNGLVKAGTEIPRDPIQSAKETNNWSGALNPNNSGMTTNIEKVNGYNAFNRLVHTDEIYTTNNTFIPAYDVATARADAKNNGRTAAPSLDYYDRLKVLRDGNTITEDGTDNSKRKFVGYLTSNLLTPPAELQGYTTKLQFDLARNKDDYTINDRGICVGAPEVNITFDEKNNGFSLNNLHSLYRFPTYDRYGNKNANAGEVGIALKRMAKNIESTNFGTNGETGTLGGWNVVESPYLFDSSVKTDKKGNTNPVPTLIQNAAETPRSRTGGIIVYNWSAGIANKFGDMDFVKDSTPYQNHASFAEHFRNEKDARRVWEKETLWGKLGFTYEQLNDIDYFEPIQQYCNNDLNLWGTTTNTKIDLSAIPTVSTQLHPTKSKDVIESKYGGGTNMAEAYTNPQNYNNFDFNSPYTSCKFRIEDGKKNAPAEETKAEENDNFHSYAGSEFGVCTQLNIVTDPTPIVARNLPTLSTFGYYLITSNLVPQYKDVVSKGEPLGLLGVVAKSSLSSQDFIISESDIVAVLNQPMNINNIDIQILNPDLTNPELESNSSIIINITCPAEEPNKVTEEKQKTPK